MIAPTLVEELPSAKYRKSRIKTPAYCPSLRSSGGDGDGGGSDGVGEGGGGGGGGVLTPRS